MDYGRLCENRDVWGYDAGFDVRRFLQFLNSPRVKDVPDFPTWVQEAAKEYDINPRMLLAIAQKEQSFLTRPGGGKGWQRALDYTMGYGATDSGDIAKYKGTRNQVYSAARGLRGYRQRGLTAAMVGKPLGRSMPGISDELTAQIVPENEATAALYLYTPHRSGAVEFAHVWAWLGEKEEAWRKASGGPSETRTAWSGTADGDGEIASARGKVVAIAKRVARAREDGIEELTINGIHFEPRESGYCAEFVREVHEAALGLPAHTWPFGAPSAREMEKKLKAAGKQIPAEQRQAGDIVAFNRLWPSKWGHIAIYVGQDARGQDLVAEDGSRGIAINPIGTRKTHISGWYSVLEPQAPGYADGPVKVVFLPESRVLDCEAQLDGGRVRCDLRPLAEKLGFEVHDRIAQQRKVYLRKREQRETAPSPGGAKEESK